MDTQLVSNLYSIYGILYPMAIHIGSVIKDALRTKKIDVTDFAKKINFTRSNAYKIFNKPSIDTELLVRINKILGENLFFNYISDQEIADYKNAKVKSGEVLYAIKDLKSTVLAMNEDTIFKKGGKLKSKPKTKKKTK